MTETKVKTDNGVVELDGLSADERKWLASLLQLREVCSLLATPADKQFAANIQAKLEERPTA